MKIILFLFLFLQLLFANNIKVNSKDIIKKKEIDFTNIREFNSILSKIEIEQNIKQIKKLNKEALNGNNNDNDYIKMLKEKYEKKYN